VDVSEEHIASIFRVEEYAKEETSVKMWGLFAICLHAGFLTGLYLNPEDGGNIYLNIGSLSTDYTAVYPRRLNC
jgi:hypothetical protein